MNLGLVKVVLWLASFGLLGGGVYAMVQHHQTAEARRLAGVTAEEQTRILDQKPPEEKKLPELPYEPVKNAFHTMNWTGKPPEVKVEVEAAPPPVQVKRHEPVDRLLQVLFIQQDTNDPDRSIGVVKYIGKLSGYQTRDQADGRVLAVGDVLPMAFDYWKLVRVDASEGLTFTCLRPGDFDQAPADETVKPPVPISGDIPLIGGNGVTEIRSPFPEVDAQTAAALGDAWPTETVRVGRGQYILGTTDAERLETEYLDILSTDVRHRTWRNPRTGAHEGIEVLEVRPGSVLSDFGVVAGDVIKSVNGHPVSSVNEAITFAKNNADYYEVWEVVVANAGKERTITVSTPPK